MIRVEIAEGNAWLDRGPDEWEDLRARTQRTPFQRFDWLNSWCKVWAKKPFVALAYLGNDLVGGWPLVRAGWYGDTLRSMGTGPSDILDPVLEPSLKEAVRSAILERICDTPEILDLHQMREPIALPSSFSTIEQARCLILDLPPTFDRYLSTLGKSLRADIKRNRSAARSSKYEIVHASESNAESCIELLLKLHRQRWKKKRLPGAFVGRSLKFHRTWLPIGISNGVVWLSILHVEGSPAGAIYAFKDGQTCFFYQAGMDPAYSSDSPGTTLIAATIERAIQEGCLHFDFLRGDESYKRRWAPQHTVTNWRYVRPGKNVLSRIHTAEIEWASELESRIRAKLESPKAKV